MQTIGFSACGALRRSAIDFAESRLEIRRPTTMAAIRSLNDDIDNIAPRRNVPSAIDSPTLSDASAAARTPKRLMQAKAGSFFCFSAMARMRGSTYRPATIIPTTATAAHATAHSHGPPEEPALSRLAMNETSNNNG